MENLTKEQEDFNRVMDDYGKAMKEYSKTTLIPTINTFLLTL